MKITNTGKGYLLALLSVVAVANVYIFSKAALAEVSIPQFGVYWFFLGLVWILLYAWHKKTYKFFRQLSFKNYQVLIFLGIIEIFSTYYFYKSIHVISNPAIVSFLGNISPVFMIVLSFFFLKERFNVIEFLGMNLVLIGAFVISYKGNMGFQDMFIDGTRDVLFYSMFSAVNYVVVKKNIAKIHPILLTISRCVFILIFSIMAMIYFQESLIISKPAFINIFIGSLLGPFLTVIAGYLALQYITSSHRAIISSTRGLFVLFGAYLYFGQFPQPIAIIGGFITIIGVLAIAYGSIRIKKLS
ncbi:MAG: DMT family transporter [Flavobacteriaceae bacterium]|nr:DMT family transporter [Flavobacteriaceae bacterium]